MIVCFAGCVLKIYSAKFDKDFLYIYIYFADRASQYIYLNINQLDAQNLFYNKFISCLCMFRAPCAHCQEVKIVLYSLWYHHTYRWLSHANLCAGQSPIGVMIPEAV